MISITRYEWTTSTEKSTRSLASGSKTPAQETLTALTIEATEYLLSIATEKNTMSWST